jgi:hypothetical protein
MPDSPAVGVYDRKVQTEQNTDWSLRHEEVDMRMKVIILATLGGLAVSACAKQEEVVAAPPPPPPGAVAGSMAADRDGDGIVDGYYTSDGIYHANYVPPPPPPPPMPTRTGERG